MKHKGHFEVFAWVAQLQTGERAKEKGLKSYRAEHGSAIHFHILTDQVPVTLVRKHWCAIVNKWEEKSGHKKTKLGGVDLRLVYNASHYVSKYISNETKSGNILGNLWGISNEARKQIGIKDGQIIDTTDQEFSAFNKAFRLSSKKHDTREITFNHSVKSMKDWNDSPIIFSKDVRAVLRAFTKWKRNLIKATINETEKKDFAYIDKS